MSNIEVKERLSTFLAKTDTQTYLATVLSDKKDKFITNLISLTSQNPTLTKCTSVSLMSGAIVATSLNLSLNKSFGYAYLVPYEDKKRGVVEAQFQIGYKGYIQLAMRTGEYKRLNAVPIYENQLIRWNELTEELSLNDVDGVGVVVGYVAFFELMNGFTKTMFWRYPKMLAHADKYSQAFKADKYELLLQHKIPENEMWKYSSFWYKSFDDMALKTMLRQLLSKYGILTEEMQKAYQYDQAIIEKDNIRYADNESTEVEIIPQPDLFAEESKTNKVNIDEI